MASVRGSARGHPNVRATHRKTLELAREPEIGERATCVVGVAAELDEGALAELHGQVELTLSAGGLVEAVRGRLNPAFQSGDALVVRRSPAVTRDAVIVGADRAASDLPRSFVRQLARPSARIVVSVEVVAQPGPGVLVVRPGGARRLEPGLESGGRVEFSADLASDDARAAIHAAHDAGHTVLPAPGLPLAEAVRAVGGFGPATQVTEDVPAQSLARRLEGAARASIVLDPSTPREQFLHWRAGEPLEVPGARGRRAAFAIERSADSDEEPSTARAEALAAAGASTRDVSRALQEDAGLPRRRAYELALGLTAETSSVSRPDPRTSR